jgi:hypothetical protein
MWYIGTESSSFDIPDWKVCKVRGGDFENLLLFI